MNNNKKVLISIIASVLVIAIAVGVLIWKWPTIKKSVFKKDDNKETTSQSAAKTQEGGSGESNNKAGNFNFETVDTGKKSVDVKDVSASASSAQIEVPVYATENPGIVAAQINITYDTDAFTFADCAGGEIFDTCDGNFDAKTKTLKIIAQNGGEDNLKLVSGAGVMCKVILKPTDKAKAGTYKLDIKTEAAGLDDKLVTVKAKAGNIVIG